VKIELRKEKKYILFSLAVGLLNMLVTFGFHQAGIYQSQCLLLYVTVAGITALATAIYYKSYKRLLGPVSSYAAMFTLGVMAGLGIAYMKFGSSALRYGPETTAIMMPILVLVIFLVYAVLLFIPTVAIFSILRVLKGEKK
jgi:hypothetical protein